MSGEPRVARTLPRLVVGLGNTGAGDDGVGCHVAECLAADGRLPPDVEVLCGGADLLRMAPSLAGRSEVLFVDACLDMIPGEVEVLAHEALAATAGLAHAHHLSAVECAELLIAVGDLRAVRVRWALVGVDEVRHEGALSSALAAALPAIVDGVARALSPTPRVAQVGPAPTGASGNG